MATNPRPTGLKLDDYKGHKRWSPSRWAWEFLRRHPDFIDECRRLPRPGAEPASLREAKRLEKRRVELAQRYGLKRFKDYRQPHGKGAVRPRFLSVAVSHWVNRDSDTDRRKVTTSLLKGQVLVRLDLRQTLGTTRALAEQLAKVERIARTEQERLIASMGGGSVGHFNRDRNNFIRHVQVLDLRASKHSWPQVARIVWPEKVEGLSRDEIKDRLVPQLKEAEAVMRQYLQIAAMAKVPPEGDAKA